MDSSRGYGSARSGTGLRKPSGLQLPGYEVPQARNQERRAPQTQVSRVAPRMPSAQPVRPDPSDRRRSSLQPSVEFGNSPCNLPPSVASRLDARHSQQPGAGRPTRGNASQRQRQTTGPADVPPQSESIPSAEVPISSQKGPELPPEFADMPVDLTPCKYCKRKFARDRVGAHEASCAQNPEHKRQARRRGEFNALRQRLDGVDEDGICMRAIEREKRQPQQAGKKPDWRQQRAQLRAALVSGRGGQVDAETAALAAAPDDRVECRWCGRKFAPDVLERHAPHCQQSFERNRGRARARARAVPATRVGAPAAPPRGARSTAARPAQSSATAAGRGARTGLAGPQRGMPTQSRYR